MIFRTITDDITGANKSIGLFGKSLNDFKGILNSFKQNGFFNTLLNTPLINIDTTAIDKYNNAIRSSIPFEKALAIARRTTNAETIALIESSYGAEVQIERVTAAQKASTIAAKEHSVALKAASIAGNMILFAFISKGIQLATIAIDNWIHRVEKARERTDELFAEFKSMNDTLADHKKTVSELADRYDELSKGVNLSTNDNVSLSTEEYEEFLDINEQMAQSFPELAKGIDENGNSILTLGTKGITAKEQLEELLQTEEDLNNFRIAQGLEEAFKGVYTYVEDANEATEKLNGTISDSNEAMSKLQDIAENGIKLSGDNGQLIFAGNTNNQAEIDYMNSLTQSINEFWKSLDGSRRVELGVDPSYLFTQQFDEYTGAFEIYANFYQLTPEEITTLENIIQDNVGDASGALLDSISDQSQELQEQINKGENAWRDFIPNLVSGMKSKQTFKDLDSDLQDIAVQIVEGLDYSYASAMKEYDPDPYAYIRDKFIVPMSKLSDDDKQKLQSSFEELLKLDADNLIQSNQAEIEKLITTIATLLEKDPLEIRVALGFDTEDVQKRYNEALKQTKRQLGGYGHDDKGFEVNNAVGNQLDSFWNENVVTEEDWALWQKVTAGIDDATEAMNAYTDAKKNENSVKLDETGNSPLSISQTIDQLNTQLKPAFDSLQSAYQDIFTDDGKFALNSIDILSTCGTIKSKLDEMSDPEGLNLDVDYSAFEDFVRVLNNTESTEQDVENAFDSLATSITQAALTGAEDFETMKDALEDLGVVNNEMVAFQALASNTEMLEQALSEANASMDDFIVNTEDGSVEATNAGRAFLEEKVGAENCAEALNILAFHKELCNLQEMNTAGEVANLKTLAENAGYTGEVIQYLTEMEQIYQEVASGTLTPTQIGFKLARAVALKAMIEGAANQVQYAPKVDWSGAVKDAGKAGKDSGKSYKDKLKEQLSDLEGVISGITGRIDDQISSINEQKSAALDSIDAQKEAIESAKESAVEALEAERDATLVGSIEYLGDKTDEEMGESGGDGIIGRFEEFRDVIGEADAHVKSISEGLDDIDGKEVSCTIHVNIETSGGTGFTGSAQVLGSMNLNSATYNAQYQGKAHYEGTAEVTGDWGVKKGGTTLVGELGQELIVFPNGRFKTVGDNGAEFVDIPANSIVFNHLQTKELLSKGNIVGRGRALASGTALANGTSNNADDSIWTTLADGSRIRDLQPGDKMYDMVQKFDAYFKSIDGNLEKLVPNSFYERNREMNQLADQISYVSSVVNNNRNVQQPVTIQVGDIHLTGVQDVNGLAHAIKTRLPNAMLQEMHRR